METQETGKRGMPNGANWSALLKSAISEPGTLSKCYSVFHQYSLGNQLLAMFQCSARGIPLGPIATFPRWKALGRSVQKGQKAIVLCMPCTFKSKQEPGESGEQAEAGQVRTGFIYRPNWFALGQTAGAEYVPPPIPDWNKAQALATLDILQEPFAMADGNCQGYAIARKVHVSPIAENPDKTLFHEIAHVVLGHTSEGQCSDSERTPKDAREMEAETVALLCVESLGLPGAAEARGYIQHWYSGPDIPEKSAKRILKAADSILKAGYPKPEPLNATDLS